MEIQEELDREEDRERRRVLIEEERQGTARGPAE